MWNALRPGGTLAVEDVDFSGYFCYPSNPAIWRYVELNTRTAERKGGDANLGPRLAPLLARSRLRRRPDERRSACLNGRRSETAYATDNGEHR